MRHCYRVVVDLKVYRQGGMTPGGWQTIFDASERFPNVALGWTALLVLVVIVGLVMARPTRPFVLRRWWLVLGIGAALLSAYAIHETYWFVTAWALSSALVVALNEWRGPRFQWSGRAGGKYAPAGTFAVMWAIGLLVVAGGVGAAQTGAVGLSQRLAEGRVTVLVGRISSYYSAPQGKNDCLSVQDHRFCFSDWQITPGFNRTQFFGSPLRDGTMVRLSVAGDTIARVELATSP
jgi:hypothetical protein